jgi:hypothetical protein
VGWREDGDCQKPFPFQAREAPAFPPTPSGGFLRFLATIVRSLSTKDRDPMLPSSRRNPTPRRPGHGYSEGRSGRKLNLIIDAAWTKTDVLAPKSRESESSLQRLGYGLFRQRRHDRVASLVWMESVICQLSFQHALLIHHRAEVIEIDQTIAFAIILHPSIQ